MTNDRKRELETPHVMHDAPLRAKDEHHFHFDEFAATLARLIASKDTRTPLTIGVSGAWGSGKTTLLQRVRRQLDATVALADATQPALLAFANDQEKPQDKFRVCRTVWFDAWKYAGEDQLLAALLRVIVVEMQATGFWNKVKAELTGPKKTEFQWLEALIHPLTKFVSAGTYELKLDDYTVDTPLKEASAFFDYFDDSLTRLLASWINNRIVGSAAIDERQGVLVVFIDDLDRCLPDKVVQVLEAIKLFLDKPGCVFVLGADTKIVQEAVASHYKDAGVTGESAGDYLEKIIQLRFELPPILDRQMGQYLDAEAKDAIDAEVRRNWPILVTGAEINPRKVKTFVNDLNLRWAMLKNSGQAEGVNRDDFTRWQVLMRAAPANFVKRVNDIDDVELRHKFLLDALKWVGGEASLDATFQEYAGSLRLRRTLREIKTFSHQFTPIALDAFVHLTAVPLPPPPPVEVKPEVIEKGVTEELAMPKAPVTRGVAREAEGAAPNVRTIGGLEFVRVPAGKFLMGSKDDNKLAFDNEHPQHTVEIPYDYWLARYPVTNDQFAKFVEAAKYKFDQGKWQDKSNHPVVNVTWRDAMAYCKWLNDLARGELQTDIVRLPTEAEWEKAARGEYGNEWPWGNDFDQNKCNSSEGGKGGTTPVGAYSPQGDSPYGAADMAGNVWEWCHSLYQPYPYKADDGRESETGSGSRVWRGGSWSQ